MKLIPLLLELDFRTYEAMVKVTFGEEGNQDYDDALRALPGVTTVTVANQDSASNIATYKIKIISQKESLEAFKSLQDNAVSKYKNIIALEVGEQTIEEK